MKNKNNNLPHSPSWSWRVGAGGVFPSRAESPSRSGLPMSTASRQPIWFYLILIKLYYLVPLSLSVLLLLLLLLLLYILNSMTEDWKFIPDSYQIPPIYFVGKYSRYNVIVWQILFLCEGIVINFSSFSRVTPYFQFRFSSVLFDHL